MNSVIRAVYVYTLALRVEYLRHVLSKIPVTHPEWARTFIEVNAAEQRLDRAFEP